jgi:formylglycine-generating enzyme required for sulfatase activity
LDDFYLGKYEVTQAQWGKLMSNNPSHIKGANYPVSSLSWNDAQDFIERLNRKTGRKYRLPTEAEWEYAARSGGKKEKYAGTSRENEIGEYAWYIENSGVGAHPVGEKKPNGLGLFDMTGNVSEWCSDWYNKDYYRNSPKNNPKGAEGGFGADHVIRGNSWLGSPVGKSPIGNPGDLRVTSRHSAMPVIDGTTFGFRVALSFE